MSLIAAVAKGGFEGRTREWTAVARCAWVFAWLLAAVAAPADAQNRPSLEALQAQADATEAAVDEIPRSWHRLLDSTNGDANGCNSDRFKCVMNDEAVLDLETGLVWEREPTTDANSQVRADAINVCRTKLVGGRFGWRLPSLKEMLTLIVTDAPNTDRLAPGHPFVGGNGLRQKYWTTTPRLSPSGDTTSWYQVDVFSGSLTKPLPHSDFGEAWCVRSPLSNEWP